MFYGYHNAAFYKLVIFKSYFTRHTIKADIYHTV